MPNPDFIIIGASRSGTSSLFNYLRQNPRIHMPAVKEVHFFDFKYGKGLQWYQGRFRSGVVNGEASPYYLPCPFVASRVKKNLPDVKIIALLREPGARAYSHYWFNRVRGEEDKPFLEAVQAEKQRLKNLGLMSAEWRRYSYLARGRYAEQLERWRGFDMMIGISESLFDDPESIVWSICAWLGVESHHFDTRPLRGQNYAPMGNRARKWLDKYFEPHNRQLKEDWGIEWEDHF